ncbi:MAG: YcxB family protein, partial [Acinetobacter sp.]
QDYAEIFNNERSKLVPYSEVQNFVAGKLTYMLELKNRTVVIVPKRAFKDVTEQGIFENTFKK